MCDNVPTLFIDVLFRQFRDFRERSSTQRRLEREVVGYHRSVLDYRQLMRKVTMLVNDLPLCPVYYPWTKPTPL
jgi:hypothetical protein